MHECICAAASFIINEKHGGIPTNAAALLCSENVDGNAFLLKRNKNYTHSNLHKIGYMCDMSLEKD